jgi:hypothetical protein
VVVVLVLLHQRLQVEAAEVVVVLNQETVLVLQPAEAQHLVKETLAEMHKPAEKMEAAEAVLVLLAEMVFRNMAAVLVVLVLLLIQHGARLHQLGKM